MRNPRVIVIDQDPASRADAQRMLALSGFAVLGEAGYGIEAVALAKEAQPDVVVIAIEEPIARALQTVRALADLMPQAPFVAYSSIRDPNTMRKAMLAGVQDYLTTPLNEGELIQSVHTVLGQEERRRARIAGEVDEPVASGTVLTVFGAKGGIGKTTIATNLATALVQTANQSVILVDMDTRFGDVAIVMDISVERSIADLAIPEEEITKELLRECIYVHSTGVAILPAPGRPTDWRSVHAGHVERVVMLLSQMYDYVILDTPGTYNDIVARSLEMASLMLLVSTMDLGSLKDTLLAIDMLRSFNFPQEKLKLVINATNDASGIQPREVKRMLGREVFWSVPYDRNISQATQLGTPVVVAKPRSKASESLVRMASALSGVRPDGQTRGESPTGGLVRAQPGALAGQVTSKGGVNR